VRRNDARNWSVLSVKLATAKNCKSAAAAAAAAAATADSWSCTSWQSQ